MTFRNAMAGLSLAGLMILAGAMVAQPQNAPSADRQAETKQQMKSQMQAKMKGGEMMGQMMTRHQEMSQLMDKLMGSMAALRAEKDPARMHAKLDEHAALLRQMQTMMTAQDSMMHTMMRNMTDSGKENRD